MPGDGTADKPVLNKFDQDEYKFVLSKYQHVQASPEQHGDQLHLPADEWQRNVSGYAELSPS